MQDHADLRRERDQLKECLHANELAVEKIRQELVANHGVKSEVLAALDVMIEDETDERFLNVSDSVSSDAPRPDGGCRPMYLHH